MDNDKLHKFTDEKTRTQTTDSAKHFLVHTDMVYISTTDL